MRDHAAGLDDWASKVERAEHTTVDIFKVLQDAVGKGPGAGQQAPPPAPPPPAPPPSTPGHGPDGMPVT